MASAFVVTPAAGKRGPVAYFLVWKDELRPALVDKRMWDSPHVAVDSIRESERYTEFVTRDGGKVFVRDIVITEHWN